MYPAAKVKEHTAGLLVITVALALALFPLWQGKFYAISDMRDVYIPLELFFQEQARAGGLPAWDPQVAWGFPVLASGQIGFFYPPLLLGRLIFPISVYLPAMLVLHLGAAAAGFYWLLRRMQLGYAAALLGTIAFIFSGFIWQHVYQLNIVLALCWFPWQLVAAKKLATASRIKFQHIAMMILLFGLPFLIGQFQIPVLTAAVASMYWLYLHWRRFGMLLKNAGTIAAVATGTVLLAAAQILPSAELFTQSSRAGGTGFDIQQANQHSYPLYHLPTLVFPRFYGSDNTYWGKRLEVEYGFYIGIFPLSLALFSAFNKRKIASTSIPNNDYQFFFWLLLISFTLALGSASPWRLIGLEPSLWIFSAPSRWLLFATTALAVLAAIGFEAMPAHSLAVRRWAASLFAIVAVLVIASNVMLASKWGERILSAAGWTVTRQVSPESQVYKTKITDMLASAQGSSVSWRSPYTILGLVVLAAVPLLVTHNKGRHILMVMTTAELVILAVTATPALSWSEILSPPHSIEKLPEAVRRNDVRVYSIREGGDTGAFFTNPQSRADNAGRRLQRELLLPMIHAQFGVSGIEWPASLPLRTQVKTLDALRSGTEYEIGDISALEELNVGALLTATDDHGVAIQNLEARPRAELVTVNGQTAGTAKYQELAPNHVQISIEAQHPAKLIVRDTWYPGWQATIDSVPADIDKYREIFRQIKVPAGSHQVTMTYSPRSVYFGVSITLLVAATCVMVAVVRFLNSSSR